MNWPRLLFTSVRRVKGMVAFTLVVWVTTLHLKAPPIRREVIIPSTSCCSRVHPFQVQDQDQVLSIRVWVLNLKFFSSQFYFLDKSKIRNSQKHFIFILNKGHICRSRDGPVPSPWVIKTQDRVQNWVIDIRVQDQDKDQTKSVSRPRPVSWPPTLTFCVPGPPWKTHRADIPVFDYI